MQKDVGIVEADASLADLERALVEARVSGFPVVRGGRVVGVVSRTDVMEHLAGGQTPVRLSHYYAELGGSEAEELLETFERVSAPGGKRVEELRVEDVMTRRVISVAPDDPLEAVARTLVDHGVHRALVIDDGILVGIVSSLDVVRLVAHGRLQSSRS